MAAILEIAQLGNPILRQTAQPIAEIDGPVRALIDSLIATAAAARGVGIAAPQVAQPRRLLIVASRPTPRYPDAPLMEPTAMVNPRIVARSAEQVKDWEGCLSIPGIRGLVPRHEAVEVEYLDREGRSQRQELTGFVARIFQHEFDHLEGMVFLDRVELPQALIAESELWRYGPGTSSSKL